jgi:iron complex outermembrane receptor protein
MEIAKPYKCFFLIACFCSSKIAFSQQNQLQRLVDSLREDSEFEFLEQVVVSNNKDLSKIKESTVGVSVIKPYLIQNRVTTNARTAFEQVPGMVVNDDQINIRNGSGWSYGAGSRVMVTLDEMPMLSGDVGSVPFSFLPVEIVDGVEVIKSAGSVLYGSSALNGVVNLSSEPISYRGKGKMNVLAGFYDIPDQYKYTQKRRSFYGINGQYTERIKQHSFGANWNQLNDDGYKYSGQDYRVRMGWRYGFQPNRLPQLKIKINGNIQKGESGNFLVWESADQGYLNNDTVLGKNLLRRFNVDPSITWNGKKWQHKLQNRFFRVKNDIDSLASGGENQDNESDFYYSEWRSSRSFKSSKKPQNYLRFTGGIVNTYTISQSPLFQGDHKALNHAAYTQLKYKSPKWVIEGGARYEYFDLDGVVRSKPVLRAGLNRQLGHGTFMRLSYGEGFRFPSMAELFTKTTSAGVSVLPNPELEPEFSRNIEFGIKQGIKGKNTQAYVDVSAFYMNIDNLMEYTFGVYSSATNPFGDAGFKSLNVSNAQISGLEIESAGQWKNKNKSFRWLAGYTYSLPIVTNPNDTIGFGSVLGQSYPITFASTRSNESNFMKYRNRHVIRGDIEYQIKDKVYFGISYRYQSAFENIDIQFFDAINGVESQFKTGKNSGHIFDIRAGVPVNELLDLTLQVRNITNTIYMGRPADLSPPRSVHIQFTYDLDM